MELLSTSQDNDNAARPRADAATECHTAHVLETCAQIRAQRVPGFCGFCHAKWSPATGVDARTKRAKIETVNWISVRVYSEDTQRPYPIESVVLTLLHELAHTITPSVLRKGVVREHCSAKKSRHSRKFRPDDHGDAFYENFRRVLEAAEEHGRFMLPSGADKHSRRSLERLDSMDMGSVRGLRLAMEGEKKTEGGRVRISVEWKGRQKLLLVERGSSLPEVCRAAAAKHGQRGELQLREKSSGRAVEALEDGAELLLTKQ